MSLIGKIDKIFEEDEMEFRKVQHDWTPDQLLLQEGIFLLKDLMDLLSISGPLLKTKLREMEAAGGNSWKSMGVRKVWNKWIVRMKLFAPFYRAHLKLPYSRVPDHWDANAVVSQTEGVYLLVDICQLIPFNSHQIRYIAKKSADSEKELGVWKDPHFKVYCVDLAKFAPWLREIWLRGITKERVEKK